MFKNRKKKGFTLIELIVVIAILGILAAVLIPKFGGFQDKARKTQILTDAKQIATAIDSLLTESTNNEFTADVTAAAATDPVIKLSGVDTTTTGFKLDYKKDGSFTLTEKLGNKTYTASSGTRNSGAHVEITYTVTP